MSFVKSSKNLDSTNSFYTSIIYNYCCLCDIKLKTKSTSFVYIIPIELHITICSIEINKYHWKVCAFIACTYNQNLYIHSCPMWNEGPNDFEPSVYILRCIR